MAGQHPEEVPVAASAAPAYSTVDVQQPDGSTGSGGRPGNPAALPERFGRYQVLRRLGQGGMGTIYLAHDTQLDRPVALKVPHFRAGDDPQVLERFHREARAAARVHHPSLCPIYDVGQLGEVHYLTMAYLQGQPLSVVLKDGPRFTPRQAAVLVRSLALALAEAHQRGVVHRDLKPSNIMINPRGEPVILDFGLARPTDAGACRLTATGDLLGTPAYMAPEQVAGDVQAIGPACDIYSLGVVLYEVLAGRVPFQGAPGMVMVQVYSDVPPPPSSHRADVDPALEAVCLKAMAKKPADRYATMTEFARALEHVLESDTEKLPAAPADRPTPARRRSLGRRLALAAGGTACALTAVVVARSWPAASIRSAPVAHVTPDEVPSAPRPAPVPRHDNADPKSAVPPVRHAPIPGVGFKPEARAKDAAPPSLALQAFMPWLGRLSPSQPATGLQQPLGRSGTETAAAVVPPAPPRAVVPFDPDRAKQLQQAWARHLGTGVEERVDLGDGVVLTLVLVPPGRFRMGSPATERNRGSNEAQLDVDIARPFYIGKFAVTCGQFRRFVQETGYRTEAERDGQGGWGYDSGERKLEGRASRYTWRDTGWPQTDEYPVVNVSWNDAAAFCAWLARKTGKPYRLPSEAEWEYSCRAGTTSRYSSGDDDLSLKGTANLADASLRAALDREAHLWWTFQAWNDGSPFTAPVGKFRANAFGLYDMHGNVGQWCGDAADPASRAGGDNGPHPYRGGSWLASPWDCRSAARNDEAASYRSLDLGFRVVVTATDPGASAATAR